MVRQAAEDRKRRAQGGGHEAEDTRRRTRGGGHEAEDRRRRAQGEGHKVEERSGGQQVEERSGGQQAEDGGEKIFFFGFFLFAGRSANRTILRTLINFVNSIRENRLWRTQKNLTGTS
jgi:hypothetical protein